MVDLTPDGCWHVPRMRVISENKMAVPKDGQVKNRKLLRLFRCRSGWSGRGGRSFWCGCTGWLGCRRPTCGILGVVSADQFLGNDVALVRPQDRLCAGDVKHGGVPVGL